MEPSTIQQTFDLAVQHHQAGRLQEAVPLYRQVIAQDPTHAEALHFLGVIAYQAGHYEQAAKLIGRAIDVRPDFPTAYNNLGNVLRSAGLTEPAIAAYRQAISLQPNHPDALNNLSAALMDKREWDQAIAASRQAIIFRPDFPEAYVNLCTAFRNTGQLDEAIAAGMRAISLRSDFPDAYNNLGNALKDKGRWDEAIATYERAIALRPDFPDAHCNLGILLKDKGEFEKALDAFRRVIDLRPDFGNAHRCLAMALLRRGDFAQGWAENEWRWKAPDFPSPQRNFPQPQWTGDDLRGRTVLLHAEQGLGDTIQFIRYVPMVASRGGKVLVEVQKELISLFQSMAGADRWIARGEALPDFDVHCPIMTLPLAFGTTLQTIPPPAPLPIDSRRERRWRSRLEHEAPGLKVAFAWAGRPTFREDRTRSLSLDRLALLSEVPGVTFYSVQKGPPAAQADHPPAGLRLLNLGPEIDDFADTATIMSLADLVITTDTSVAHLAGTLGRPTWVMLQFVPDWRWMVDRTDSPWYPNMRLFRQSSLGDWPGVIRRVVEELGKLARMPVAGRSNTV